MNKVNFQGHDCIALSNPKLELLVTQSVGPRILSLRMAGGNNLLANLPDFKVIRPDGAVYRIIGGHRLWHSPEHMPRTYHLDDQPVEAVETIGGLTVTQPVEPDTGLQKTIQIELDPEQARLTITHRLTNLGMWAVECAPWAITQLRPGGVAILPLATQDTGLLPNRSLAIWPYTRMDWPQVHWGDEYIWLEASVPGPFKVGFANPRGWLGCWLDGCLFVKRAAYQPGRSYYDFGCSSECYCNQNFLELETLAPITNIQPGESALHIEHWEVFSEVSEPHSEEDIRQLAAQLGLG